jgi:quercetin dioxygenase-like cupin family protein
MSLRQADLAIGNIRGTIYTFEQAGDVLPWHVHGQTDAHITIVARGQMRMETSADRGRTISDTYELAEGHCIDTGPGVFHQFTALTDNVRIFNIIKEPAL